MSTNKTNVVDGELSPRVEPMSLGGIDPMRMTLEQTMSHSVSHHVPGLRALALGRKKARSYSALSPSGVREELVVQRLCPEPLVSPKTRVGVAGTVQRLCPEPSRARLTRKPLQQEALPFALLT